MTVNEGKWFSKMLVSRKTFAEYTKMTKIPLYPVILSKTLRKSADKKSSCLGAFVARNKKMQNEPNPNQISNINIFPFTFAIRMMELVCAKFAQKPG